MQPISGGVDLMAKVNKAFSIDPDTFLMLDRYCAASETWDKRRSRSAVVNEAIRWYLQGNNADMITEDHKELLQKYREKCLEIEKLQGNKLLASNSRSWWRKILGI